MDRVAADLVAPVANMIIAALAGVGGGRGDERGQQDSERTPGTGRFTVLRQTIRKRLQTKLSEVKAELRWRWHDPIPKVGAWLRSVVLGHLQYYRVPMNRPALFTFCFQVGRLWYRALARRSHTGRPTWERVRRLIQRWLPPPRITHPYPLRRLGVVTWGKSPAR